MTLKLLIDPSCDLPKSIYERYNIGILPVNVKLPNKEFLDYRQAENAIKYLDKQTLNDKQVDTEPASEEILQEVLTKATVNHQYILIVTACRKRSETFFNIQPIVEKLNKSHTSMINIVDSRSLFSGQSVLAAHAVALWTKTPKLPDVRHRLNELADNIYSYMIPGDLMHVRRRAQKRGDQSVSWASAALAQAVDICPVVLFRDENTQTVQKIKGFNKAIDYVINAATASIKKDTLKSPFICLSFAGDIDGIKSRDSFITLKQTANSRHIKVLASPMSITSAIHIGMGGFTLAIACENAPI